MTTPVASGTVTVTTSWTEIKESFNTIRNLRGTLTAHNSGTKTVNYGILVSNKEDPGDIISAGALNLADWAWVRRERLRWDSNNSVFVGETSSELAANSSDADWWRGPFRHTAVVAKTNSGTTTLDINLLVLEG